MKRWQFVKRLAPLMAFLVLVLSACGREDLSALNPQGPVAQEQLGLMKISITIMSFVVIAVFAISIIVLIKFRRRKGDNTIPKQVEGSHKLEIIWTVIPVILLVLLAIPTLKSVFTLSKDYSKDPNALQVIVTAHQFWWEFEYPELGISTAQELVVPTDRVISIQAKTADVLHSFWIPSLAGKIDTNPDGNVNKMYFEAPKAGVYLGKCAELCGPSHGLMDFKVKAVDPSSFERWQLAMTDTVELPSDPEVASAFESKCLTCHAVGENGGSAPNLTGIGSRQSVGGILINVEEGEQEYKYEDTVYNNLHKWIQNPEAYKPGNKMTGQYGDLTEKELTGIAEYLSNLTLDYE